ncbi:MAG: VIT domain-containing protein [Myxococcota bacterium]
MHLLLLALSAPAAATTRVRVDVVGPVAEVALSRSFHNPKAVAVDAELLLPVPPGAAIDAVEVTVDGQPFRSSVREAAEAQAVYRAAVAAGTRASLTAQDDGVLVQNVANVPPGADVDVSVHLVLPVARDAGAWTLTLPLTVSPRFDDDLDVVYAIPPEAPPWVTAPPARPEDTAQIEVAVHTDGVRFLEAPSHPFHADIGRTEATLRVDDARLDRDLVVRWATALPEPAARLLVADGHGLLVVEAPAPFAPLPPTPLDLVLVVDASDSMLGRRSARVPAVAEALLRRLHPDDRVTVLRFGDTVRGLAVRAAPDEVADLPARLATAPIGGGTRLADALRAAASVPAPPERPVVVVVVSDGATGDREGALQALQRRPDAVVHTVAVGAAPNHALLDALAAAHHGLALTVPPAAATGPLDDAPVRAALAPLGEGLGSPLLTGATLALPDGAELAAPLPPLFPDRAATASLRGVSCSAPVTLQGTLGAAAWSTEVRPTCLGDEAARPLQVLWARERLGQPGLSDAERAALSVEYQVLDAATRFVGVDEATAVARADGRLLRALPLPEDYALDGTNVGRSYRSSVEVLAGRPPGRAGAARPRRDPAPRRARRDRSRRRRLPHPPPRRRRLGGARADGPRARRRATGRDAHPGRRHASGGRRDGRRRRRDAPGAVARAGGERAPAARRRPRPVRRRQPPRPAGRRGVVAPRGRLRAARAAHPRIVSRSTAIGDAGRLADPHDAAPVGSLLGQLSWHHAPVDLGASALQRRVGDAVGQRLDVDAAARGDVVSGGLGAVARGLAHARRVGSPSPGAMGSWTRGRRRGRGCAPAPGSTRSGPAPARRARGGRRPARARRPDAVPPPRRRPLAARHRRPPRPPPRRGRGCGSAAASRATWPSTSPRGPPGSGCRSRRRPSSAGRCSAGGCPRSSAPSAT